ncbi:MAG: ATP:cob(I)alamin adenosyltransferase [Bacteroidetes bacterium B1(2017)]|nr:MAG: ATP:cob(I)alamin adenosyltransferase [Bacteroidetes bacterium B1(2017)]
MSFKIYTKTGDKGETSLIGGVRVLKSHMRIESYGTIDELNSYLGIIKDLSTDQHRQELLYEIQDRLFTIGSVLASDPEKSKMKIPDLHDEDIALLEKEIDKMNETLPELKSFILPGGNLVASHCHVARCICRRAERMVVLLQSSSAVPDMIVIYLNRLSDYLFVLSRQIVFENKGEEVAWRPRI